MEMFKQVLLTFTVFTIAMILLNQSLKIVDFPELPDYSNLESKGVLNYIWDLITYSIAIVFISIPNQAVVNMFLWACRLVILLEIIVFVRDLFKV